MKYGAMDNHLEAVSCDCKKHQLKFWIARVKMKAAKPVSLVSEAILKAVSHVIRFKEESSIEHAQL